MPEGRTSFYDALLLTIEELSKGSSKSVVVALTDGQDNESTSTYQDVIDLANENEITIYTIGLGSADTEMLKHISLKTDGFYYHTNDPEKLKEIYLNIKEQIRSIYQVDYISNNLDYLNEERAIKFSFVNDTLQFANNSAIYDLPQEAISYLKKKEEERKSNERNKLIFGGISLILLGIGSFLVYRKKTSMAISKIYPNPFADELNIHYKAPKSSKYISLKVIDISGNIVYETKYENVKGSEKISLEHLNSGVYGVQISNGSKTSKVIKVIKK